MRTPLYSFPLKFLRHQYLKMKPRPFKDVRGIQDLEAGSNILYQTLESKDPCMIARFGAFELSILINYLSIKSRTNNVIPYITGKKAQWWWNKNLAFHMQNNAGFFPADKENLKNFCELMIRDINKVDVLGSWLYDEIEVDEFRSDNSINIHLRLIEPFWSEIPWTNALKGKNVLVIHPFSETIESQYKKRNLIFEKEILPEFNLLTIKAVQSLGGKSDRFGTWFDALDWMKSEMDKKDFDICLIGAGAYGFSLAAHAKDQGKKSVHLGGALQLLFGIRGKRWENPNYGVKTWGLPLGSYSGLMNSSWVRPGETNMPKNANSVENACYW